MNPLELSSHAKVNLRLDILSRRPDGYHEIRTIFQKISLADDLTISIIKSGIEVRCDNPLVPCNESNLVHVAARMLLSRYGIRDGVRIAIKKRIPIAAGLGGGSSNAASTLQGVNELFGLGMSSQELMKTGRDIGADVPFFLFGNSAIGTGIGEKLEPLSIQPKLWFVLVTPDIQISTAWAYQNVRTGLTKDAVHITIPPFITDLAEIISMLSNDLEKVALPRFPVIQDIKDDLMNKGALGSLMSGSGSTVFGIFASEGKAKAAPGQMTMRKGWQDFVCCSA